MALILARVDEKDTPVRRFADELDDLLDRYEGKIPVGSIIGTLHLATHCLCQQVVGESLRKQALG